MESSHQLSLSNWWHRWHALCFPLLDVWQALDRTTFCRTIVSRVSISANLLCKARSLCCYRIAKAAQADWKVTDSLQLVHEECKPIPPLCCILHWACKAQQKIEYGIHHLTDKHCSKAAKYVIVLQDMLASMTYSRALS